MSKRIVIPHSKPTIDRKDILAVSSAIKSAQLSQGKKAKEFETKLAKRIGTGSAVATSSGTVALHLALLALGVKKGDEVIIPTYVCTALLNAVLYVGATPKLVDVNADDFNICAKDVECRITKKTKAIIVPHMFGQAADLSAFLKLKIPIVEDCAQAIGARYRGKPVGSYGKLSIFSFYATKVMTTAEGGAVYSKDAKLIRKIADLRDYDHKNDYKLRFNYKMTDIAAALGLTQLSKLNSFIAKRKEIAAAYNKKFSKCTFELPAMEKGKDHIYFRYIIKTKNKTALMKKLKAKGIGCAAPVYKPLHRYLNKKRFPAADNLICEAISIPIYPMLSQKQIQYISETIQNLMPRKTRRS